ncbi:MAG: SDR family NAD(P)-dependent oxidoreductase [Hamadaea sp.]|uniref:SDR family NAD(P)-dependent oxidoreductase n=1 Tax=Hamadaea sp. TaxID=2024425 RepID=UPI0017E91EA7|nr:SDR family NAD(P)-dependent oxidoreductase [Hamadaea sp.]NUR70370.1 SDR family NAD(P)-dependent oxidoreductase [Hamadaea sp.]NUT20530.1 SDR family NAD(P)-dependent oxidoreductase [Hamadaea sp.]
MGTLAVFGAGPGLGLSIAHRFGREGHRVALVSRTPDRHAGYRSALADAGIEADTFVADVRDRAQLDAAVDAIGARFGAIDIAYYGPGALDPADRPKPVTQADSDSVRTAMTWVYAAVDLVGAVLPGMVARGDGGLLFAGGLSSVVPMPALGNLALSSAALRNYAVTLNAGLADQGVYAGTLTIGGLIERGDIHRFMSAESNGAIPVLDPDELADAAWQLYSKRDRAEAVFNALG